MKILVLLLMCIFLFPVTATAQYSDYYANKSSGQRSSNLTLKYGGTYGHAARNYMNYRHGYGTGRNSDYYSTRYPVRKQKAEINRLLKKSDYYSTRYPVRKQSQGVSPKQQAEINSLLKKSDALINRIENDPRIWR